jgi:hypothetical protein
VSVPGASAQFATDVRQAGAEEQYEYLFRYRRPCLIEPWPGLHRGRTDRV